MEDGDLDVYKNGSNSDLNIGAMHYADAIVKGAGDLNDDVMKHYNDADRIKFEEEVDPEAPKPIIDFYESLMQEEEK